MLNTIFGIEEVKFKIDSRLVTVTVGDSLPDKVQSLGPCACTLSLRLLLSSVRDECVCPKSMASAMQFVRLANEREAAERDADGAAGKKDPFIKVRPEHLLVLFHPSLPGLTADATYEPVRDKLDGKDFKAAFFSCLMPKAIDTSMFYSPPYAMSSRAGVLELRARLRVWRLSAPEAFDRAWLNAMGQFDGPIDGTTA